MTTAKRLYHRRSPNAAHPDVNVAPSESNLNGNNDVETIPIVVGFTQPTLIRDYILAFRRQGSLWTDKIGITSGSDKSKVFIFEHLTSNLRKVYLNAKKFQKANGYKYLWSKEGKIFLRRSDDSKIIRVLPHTDLMNIENNREGNPKTNAGERRGDSRGGVSSS